MSQQLRNYKILLADSDTELGYVLKKMLADMGFADLHLTRSGREAANLLKENAFDFLITEKNTQHLDGIGLIHSIRRDSISPNPIMPIIMLAGSAEQSDVVAARDAGINEYLVKPFSAKTVYNRLERIIEHPRQFVISQGFIGPTRRHKAVPPVGQKDRRTARIAAQLGPRNPAGKVKPGPVPTIWLPDVSLKLKLGNDVRLNSLITPAVLNHAQASVDAITDQSLQWIKDNLEELKAFYMSLIMGDHSEALTASLADISLTLNSRAGTFGYARASEIAYMLYLFCRNNLKLSDKNHHMVIKKNIDVLQIILGNQMKGDAGEIGEKIAAELRNLVQKYAT